MAVGVTHAKCPRWVFYQLPMFFSKSSKKAMSQAACGATLGSIINVKLWCIFHHSCYSDTKGLQQTPKQQEREDWKGITNDSTRDNIHSSESSWPSISVDSISVDLTNHGSKKYLKKFVCVKLFFLSVYSIFFVIISL